MLKAKDFSGRFPVYETFCTRIKYGHSTHERSTIPPPVAAGNEEDQSDLDCVCSSWVPMLAQTPTKERSKVPVTTVILYQLTDSQLWTRIGNYIHSSVVVPDIWRHGARS